MEPQLCKVSRPRRSIGVHCEMQPSLNLLGKSMRSKVPLTKLQITGDSTMHLETARNDKLMFRK